MEIDEAIEIKSREGDEFLHTDPDKLDEADRLSLEALKRLQFMRQHLFPFTQPPLPGETERRESEQERSPTA